MILQTNEVKNVVKAPSGLVMTFAMYDKGHGHYGPEKGSRAQDLNPEPTQKIMQQNHDIKPKTN